MVEEPRSEKGSEQAGKSEKGLSFDIWVRFGAVLLGAVLLAVLVTYSVMVGYESSVESEEDHRFRVLQQYMDSVAYYDYDYDSMLSEAIRAYVAASGDDYTVYYDAEEFEQLTKANQGNYVGIGVSAEAGMTVYADETVKVLRIATVQKNSPAQKAGVLKGDEVLAIVNEGSTTYVNDVSYSEAMAFIRGEAGSSVGLILLREVSNERVRLEVNILREELTLESVSSRISETDATVGILTVSGFDLTTPTSLKRCMDSLLEQGIGRFVIDLRDNGGGDLASVVACASYFLNPKDVILSTKDKDGNQTVYTAKAQKRSGEYASCSVSEEEIGMYRGYSYAILINGNTASAAELLAAVFRDYSLGVLVGEQSYGKGSVQGLYPLKDIGLEGGLRVTTKMYFPPCGEGYNNIGITPDILAFFPENKHLGTVAEHEDTQLACAIANILKTK